ncbi:MAG: hypothetical protein Q8K37_02260, partial [Alphaproteobacteria bacterium]|nr:hypothetical protein [Alphaproteobacteria bacterium]
EVLNPIENYNGSKLLFFCGHSMHCGTEENPAHADYYTIDLRSDIKPDLAANLKTEMNLISEYFANANRKFDLIVLEGGMSSIDTIAFRRKVYDLLAPGGKLVVHDGVAKLPNITIKAEEKRKFIESDEYTIEVDGSLLKKEDLVFLKNVPKDDAPFHKKATLKYCEQVLGLEGLSEVDSRDVCAAELISNYFKLPLDKKLLKFSSHVFCDVDDEEFCSHLFCDIEGCEFCKTENIQGNALDHFEYFLEFGTNFWGDRTWHDEKIADFYPIEAFELYDSVYLPKNYAEIIEKKFSDYGAKIGDFTKVVFSSNLEHLRCGLKLIEYYKDIIGDANQGNYFVFLEK